jgi:hypothetical protein
MIFLTIFFSVFSTGMMSYLAMSTHLGPWMAPIFSVVVIILILPLFKAQWFRRHAVIMIATGSVGGMIGICLGLSLPSFYFMHRTLFDYWSNNPIHFSMIILGFIFAAASYAFFLGYVLKDYFLVKTHPEFPMSKLIYDVIYVDKTNITRLMMIFGVVLSSFWNILSHVGKFSLSYYSAFMHMAPMLSSIGFMSGVNSAPSILIGLITRIIIFRLVHIYVPNNLTEYAFLITFCSGMLFCWFVFSMIDFSNKKFLIYWKDHFFSIKKSFGLWIFSWYLLTASTVFLFFIYWGMSILFMVLVFIMLIWLAWYMVNIISDVGVIEIDTYVWFILLIAIYFIPSTSLSIVALSVFGMLCLGLVVDFMFSYKLADLSGIEYKVIFKYQLIAVIASACTAGFWFWNLDNIFNLGSFDLIANKAHQFDSIVRYSKYNYKIFLTGFGFALCLSRFTNNILTITGGVLMTPFFSVTLIASGAVAHLIKNREKFYPLCFGIYAGHMLWMIFSIFI